MYLLFVLLNLWTIVCESKGLSKSKKNTDSIIKAMQYLQFVLVFKWSIKIRFYQGNFPNPYTLRGTLFNTTSQFVFPSIPQRFSSKAHVFYLISSLIFFLIHAVMNRILDFIKYNYYQFYLYFNSTNLGTIFFTPKQ